MQRLVTPSTFPLLEYAGGVRFQSTGYTGSQWNYNGAFPRLLRVGRASNLGLYFTGCTNLNSVHIPAPALTLAYTHRTVTVRFDTRRDLLCAYARLLTLSSKLHTLNFADDERIPDAEPN
jgi:hypothetical protein